MFGVVGGGRQIQPEGGGKPHGALNCFTAHFPFEIGLIRTLLPLLAEGERGVLMKAAP